MVHLVSILQFFKGTSAGESWTICGPVIVTALWSKTARFDYSFTYVYMEAEDVM